MKNSWKSEVIKCDTHVQMMDPAYEKWP